jgi:RNA recognition motif-containing protein
MSDDQGSEAKLFIGGLAWTTDERGLEEAFGKYGQVTSVKVITDRGTNRSKGYGFVTFANKEDAQSAVDGLNNQELDGRQLRVDFATEKPDSDRRSNDRGRSGPYDRPRRSFNDRGGRGGRGRGGFRGDRGGRDRFDDRRF